MAKSENQFSSRDKRITYEKIKRVVRSEGAKVHFVGVGGVSMYSLARLTLSLGAQVTGSDRAVSERGRDLLSRGAQIFVGHSSENSDGASLVVYSHAIHDDNPELISARGAGIPTVSRAEYLGALMTEYNSRIGVSGTHGKSTATAMLDAIFTHAMTDPTVLAGAELSNGTSMREGGHSTLIYEACEYKDSFLKFSPTIAIALNLELDHTDYFKDIFELRESFRRAMSHATRCAIINCDDSNLKRLIPYVKAPVITFGQRPFADYQYLITKFMDHGFEFDILKHGSVIGTFTLNIPGVYNVSNATAAIVASLEFGIDVDTVKAAISEFAGIPRRLEYLGDRFLRSIYYDYAHHPTAITAVINAVKMLTHDAVTVVFKPHTYSRTKSLWEEFRRALSIADYVVVTDIYPAREAPIEGISSRRLAWELGDNAIYCDDADVAAQVFLNTHGTIIIMGAGDMQKIKEDIMKKTEQI